MRRCDGLELTCGNVAPKHTHAHTATLAVKTFFETSFLNIISVCYKVQCNATSAGLTKYSIVMFDEQALCNGI